MRQEGVFLKTKEDFDKTNKFINNVFCTKNDLPEKVFNDNYGNFLFQEFDWTTSGEFWNTISSIAKLMDDNLIIVAVQDPHPVDYYYKHFSYYNWAEIPLEFTNDQYYEFIATAPKDSEADAIIYNTNTIAWMSPSMKWGIWGDRSYGICILAFEKATEIDNVLPILETWRQVKDSIDWIAINFKDQKIPKNFKNRIIDNFEKNNTKTFTG